MKKVVLTSVFALVFGCLVSYAAPAPRGGKAPEKPKTEKIDKKGGDKNHVAHKPAPKPNHKPVAHKPAPKPNHKPVAHKPNYKPNKHVAHKPHKPNHKQVCHVKHHHKPECHKPHHKVVLNPIDPFGIRALTTAAIVAAIID
jgi:outer membrane biosynthesis protein TonB